MFAMLMGFMSAAGAAYKCVDEKGVTHIGDTPPDPCATVVMYEISRSGQVLRKIDPTPTPEQLKARLEEAARQREADKIAAEQKRKDLALINSFAAEREFDVARDRNIEPLTGRIRSAEERIKAVNKRTQDLEDEMDFYRAGKSKTAKTREPPPPLLHELERVRTEKAALEKSIVAHQKEIEALKEKFETDKQRWLALKADPSTRNQQPEAPKAATTLIPGAAGKANCNGKVYECQAGKAYYCREAIGGFRVDCVVERK
jgi:chromosome segregation ATPase